MHRLVRLGIGRAFCDEPSSSGDPVHMCVHRTGVPAERVHQDAAGDFEADAWERGQVLLGLGVSHPPERVERHVTEVRA